MDKNDSVIGFVLKPRYLESRWLGLSTFGDQSGHLRILRFNGRLDGHWLVRIQYPEKDSGETFASLALGYTVNILCSFMSFCVSAHTKPGRQNHYQEELAWRVRAQVHSHYYHRYQGEQGLPQRYLLTGLFAMCWQNQPR